MQVPLLLSIFSLFLVFLMFFWGQILEKIGFADFMLPLQQE